jgi:hypothetical protein
MAEMDMKEMIDMNKEDVMNMNMEDMTDVNFNDPAELNMLVISEVNVDDLMADVAEVQTILECNNIGQMVDVNEIYEKLEELTYIRREQRIEYVATQLLHKLGVIVEPDVAPEERVFRFSAQRNQDSPVENSRWPHERSAISEMSGSGGTRIENNILYNDDIAAAASCENCNTGPPRDFCQNFMSVPAPGVIFSNALVSNQSQTNTEHNKLEIRTDRCQEFDPYDETLIKEARLIYNVLPHHDFQQIYACLEANRDCAERIDSVIDIFLQIDAESGVRQLPLPCPQVSVTSSVDTSHVVSVRTNHASLFGPSVSPLITPSVDETAVCHNWTAPYDENIHSIKHSVSANPSLPQKMSANADLKGAYFSTSEHRDKEWCQETNRNVDREHIHIFHNVDINIENAHKVIADKLRSEAQHKEGKGSEENFEIRPSSFERKVSEGSIEATPLSPEQDVNKESAEVIALFVEQKISKEGVEMTPLFAEEKISKESVEVTLSSPAEEQVEATPPSVEQKISDVAEVMPSSSVEQKLNVESVEVPVPMPFEQEVSEECVQETLSSAAEQKIHEESFELAPASSCKNIVELAASENGVEVSNLTVSDEEEEDTLSYNSCKDLDASLANLKKRTHVYDTDGSTNYDANREIDESHPSSNVPEIVQSQNLTKVSALSSSSQDSTGAQSTIVHCTDLSEETGSIITDFEIILRESDTDAAERFENSDDLTSVTKEEEVGDPAEVEECSNASFEHSNTSFDSTYADDLINFLDGCDEEQQGDKIVAKLQELFPDASIDFLTKISLQFDSLTDMANRVLECIEKEEKDDDVGDTVTEAVSPVAVPVSKPLSQGCRKKEITYEEFASSLPHVDPVFLMKKWEMIGGDYNAVKEFIAQQVQETSNDNQYHMLLSLFPHADPTFLREKCSVIGSNEAALKDFVEEQSRNNTDAQYHTLQAIFPQADSAFLRKKCVEIGNDEAAMREFVLEHLKKIEGDDWYYNLMSMFPDADPTFLQENVKRIGDDEDAMGIFVTQQLDEVDGVKFQTLLAVLPDADPDYLRATFEKIGNDEESIKIFLLESLENKNYPTREEFLKRQEMATLRRKYKEEFSIEDFIKMFPDPWKHFCEENNNSNSELIRNHGISYLETRYRMITLNDIRMSFQKNSYNLTLTCKELDGWTGPFQPPRDICTCTPQDTQDIPVSFLQEASVVSSFLLWQL